MIHESTTQPLSDLGVRTHVEAALDLLGSIDGLEAVDVGCGEGQNARGLAAAGARVTGFDPFIEATQRVAESSGSYALLQATADALPLADASADVVLFIFSLHHVPGEKLDAALGEARRVLKPSGRLLVAEPLAEGPGHYVGSLFHDETVVRAAAAAALNASAAPRFGTRRVAMYTDRRRYASYEAYADRQIRNRRFNGYTEEAVLQPEVRRRFEEVFAASQGAFDQPVRIDLFSDPH
jgi:ubiquinone/menaquinone biosynthesis C-methylase UbiE